MQHREDRPTQAVTSSPPRSESLGFSNREGKRDGPVNYFYELDL
jgi:hypothetical protein